MNSPVLLLSLQEKKIIYSTWQCNIFCRLWLRKEIFQSTLVFVTGSYLRETEIANIIKGNTREVSQKCYWTNQNWRKRAFSDEKPVFLIYYLQHLVILLSSATYGYSWYNYGSRESLANLFGESFLSTLVSWGMTSTDFE